METAALQETGSPGKGQCITAGRLAILVVFCLEISPYTLGIKEINMAYLTFPKAETLKLYSRGPYFRSKRQTFRTRHQLYHQLRLASLRQSG